MICSTSFHIFLSSIISNMSQKHKRQLSNMTVTANYLHYNSSIQFRSCLILCPYKRVHMPKHFYLEINWAGFVRKGATQQSRLPPHCKLLDMNQFFLQIPFQPCKLGHNRMMHVLLFICLNSLCCFHRAGGLPSIWRCTHKFQPCSAHCCLVFTLLSLWPTPDCSTRRRRYSLFHVEMQCGNNYRCGDL